MNQKMKKASYCLIILVFTFMTASCYKLVSTFAPREVEPGQTFEVSFTVVDDGSATQNFVTDWSYAGIRLPRDGPLPYRKALTDSTPRTGCTTATVRQ